MHKLFIGNPVHFLHISGGCGIIHVIAERCQEQVSDNKIPSPFQVAKFCFPG